MIVEMTPIRDEAAVKLARRSYPSFTKTVIEKLPNYSDSAFGGVVILSKLQSNDVRAFSWDTIWSEFQTHMPHLVSFLQVLIPMAFDGSHKCVILMIISIILKYRNPKMCLVQKVLAIFLFGNSVHKKVRVNCLKVWYVYQYVGLQLPAAIDGVIVLQCNFRCCW